MPSVLRKLLSFRNLLNRRTTLEDEIVEEKWIADFSKSKNIRFDIKSETSYDANLRKNQFYSGYSLALGLKKTGCIAWVEAPNHRYRDHVISGSIRIDARGGYGAGGIHFRTVDSGTYYSLLVSNKSYYRLDAMRNGMPLPLIGWTELPLSTGAVLNSDQSVDFTVIAHGSHLLLLLRGRWAAEINDSSIIEGTVCFTAASYESGDPSYKVIREEKSPEGASYAVEVFLESLTVDSRIAEVSALYEKWSESPDIDSRARVNLAETFTAMDQHNAAMIQLRRAWDTAGHNVSQRELLLAGRLAQTLGLMEEAEAYIGRCFQEDVESPEGKEALTEMAKILYERERYGELRDYCIEAIKLKNNDPLLWTFQGHAFWNLKNYKKASAAYDKAFSLDRENGILAKNAANVYDVLGLKKEALTRYLDAGRAFLKTGNYNDLGLLVPTLLSVGEENWEARSLAGKWAFAVEDWDMADAEFRKADELRKTKRPRPKKDGAQVFLEALLLIRNGKRLEALPLLEEAAVLEKDYALFRFRLAETLFLLNDDPDDSHMLDEMNAALALSEKDDPSGENNAHSGWVNNFAAQVALRKGNLEAADKYLEKAVAVLGDLPAVRVNQGVLFYLRGSLDKALELLDGDRQADPEGIMANCAGNLLVRAGRFEDADEKYRKALAAGPDNTEYLSNRASCLIKLNLYGEADELLARAHTIAPSPALLEMISYVAAKKGEYPRAEQACRAALEMDPDYAPSLLSLGWVLLTLGKHEEVRGIVRRLDKMVLKEDIAAGLEELREHLDDLFYQTIDCVSCDLAWKVPKNQPTVPAIRLYAMPPDDLPAGSCTGCGKTYCIGCAKKNIDESGRFICCSCGRPLKLVNEGLKKLIYDWAVKDGLVNPDEDAPPNTEKRGRGRPRKTVVQTEVPSVLPSVAIAEKRRRGRPPKAEQKKESTSSASAAAAQIPAPEKRGRGRPRKTEQNSEVPITIPEKRRRGRPRKNG